MQPPVCPTRQTLHMNFVSLQKETIFRYEYELGESKSHVEVSSGQAKGSDSKTEWRVRQRDSKIVRQ